MSFMGAKRVGDGIWKQRVVYLLVCLSAIVLAFALYSVYLGYVAQPAHPSYRPIIGGYDRRTLLGKQLEGWVLHPRLVRMLLFDGDL